MDPIRLAFPVKTYDVDFAGIVSNIVYVRWLEDLRLELLARTCPLTSLVAEGIGPVLLETRLIYREALTIHDRPEGRMFVEDRKSTRLNSSHANISYAVFCLKKRPPPRGPQTPWRLP